MLLALLVGCLCMGLAWSRPTVGPPSIKLKSTISNIALMRLVASDADGLLHFELIKNLHNEATEPLKIKVDPQLATALQMEQTYVVGYMAWLTDRFTKEVSQRPEGPVLMNLPGAEPALLPADENTVALLQQPVEESLNNGPKLWPLIEAGLLAKDPKTQHFFVVELITRAPFLPQPAVQQHVERLMTDPEVSWHSKQFILAFAGMNEAQMTSQWFCQLAARTLNHASTQINIQGTDAGFLDQLLRHIRHCPNDVFPVNLNRWVTSSHSGLVEAAINALRERDLTQAITAVESGLQQGVLAQPIRQTLNNYLKRLHNERLSKQNQP